jgi:hypothetical protein
VDPVSLALGGALLISGMVLGRVSRSRANTQPPAVCSCSHGWGTHDQPVGRCHGDIRRTKYDSIGDKVGYTYVPCPCRAYDGPESTSVIHLPGAWTAPQEQ